MKADSPGRQNDAVTRREVTSQQSKKSYSYANAISRWAKLRKREKEDRVFLEQRSAGVGGEASQSLFFLSP